MRLPAELRHLHTWEEVVGVLTGLVDEDGVLMVNIGRIALALPIDMADTLRPNIGQRCAILKTDDRARPYRFRIVAKNSPAGAPNTDIGDENCAQTTGDAE
jgi:hypothetical protein